MKTPFNSPRDPALPPYHLRNGLPERAEIDRHEAEHRRRMGMNWPKEYEQRVSPSTEERERFMHWYDQTKLIPNDPMGIAWEAWQAAKR